MSFYVTQAKFAMISDGIPRVNIDSVEQTANHLAAYVRDTPGLNSLLLLGFVQSGKTNGMIMTLAKLIEFGYRHFVILTGNDNDLYEQTYTRVECTNLGVHLVGKEQLNGANLLEIDQDSTRIIVFVVQKYGAYINRLNDIFETTGEPFVVIDDEADQASLDTNKNNPNNDTSIINGHISSMLRNTFAKAYIQVTATPYALLLQERDDIFRPKRTFILEPGNGYVGGEELFLLPESNKYHRIYDMNDMIFRDDVNMPTVDCQ
ncbi:MAG: DEAD/DEAH box helicase family protein [Desulfosporosinus sp.]|nr:DEAD/DEAH box helicase family protein [Desulfosporosinus sp.]